MKILILLCSCVLIVSLVCGENVPSSPCPLIFRYAKFSNRSENVYGIMKLMGVRPVDELVVHVNLSVATDIYRDFPTASLIAVNPTLSVELYNSELPVYFRVIFAENTPVHKLTALAVNNETICQGPEDYPQLNKYLLTTSLRHTFKKFGVFEYDFTDSLGHRSTGAGTPPPTTTDFSSFYHSMMPAKQSYEKPTSNSQQSSSAGNNECGVTVANEDIPLIYGGNPYMRGDLPWLVAIYRRNGGALIFLCGGSLVSKRHIVTAAHCMYQRSKKTPVEDFVLKIGAHDLNDWSDDITVTRTVIKASIHESYNSSSLEGDIMVFSLNKEVPYNKYIRPVCLWSGNTELYRIVGTTGNVAGWGEQAGIAAGVGAPSMVRMPIVSKNDCLATRSQYHAFTNTYCAGARDGSGPCVGDSGGGMSLHDSGKWRLRGIVSSSLRSKNPDRTCELSEYIIFTDVAQYLPWIKNILNENTFD